MNSFTLVGRVKSEPKQLTDFGGTYHAFEMEVYKNFQESDLSHKVETFWVSHWHGMSQLAIWAYESNENIVVTGRLEATQDKIILIAENIEMVR